jgi:hypothetical protein
MAYDINDTSQIDPNQSEDLTKSRKIMRDSPERKSESEGAEDDEEEVDEEDEVPVKVNKNIYSTQGIDTTPVGPSIRELPKFDFSEFYNLNVDNETKELLTLMNR